MSIMRNMLMQMFGRPQGVLGRLGGIIMTRTNEGCGAWVTELLKIEPNDTVLEVGFGPGVIVQRLSKLALRGALGFTLYSGQPNEGLTELLMAAGFTNAIVVAKDKWFCALASKP